MKALIKPGVVALLFILLVAARPDNSCLVLFKQAHQKFKQMYVQNNSKGLALKYQVDVTTTDGKDYHDVIEMKSYKEKSKVTSGRMTIYQDAATVVSIQPENKTIFLTKPLPEASRKNQMEGALLLQDSMFSHISVKSCVNETVTSKTVKKIALEVPASKQKTFGMKYLTYWIDEKAIEVRKVMIEYAQGQQMKQSSYSIDKFDTKFKSTPFQGSAMGIVFDGNRLRQNYKGYTLIDKR